MSWCPLPEDGSLTGFHHEEQCCKFKSITAAIFIQIPVLSDNATRMIVLHILPFYNTSRSSVLACVHAVGYLPWGYLPP
ncbi:hypothetical protein BC938DRAFT_478062 [Jimgerdemannia flammicorona]|uniref:Uncharacterized protein n=1 Tax=Jimgerdemannia flammicorona TaxID=994334 RepID=A0A433QNF6_9FUNG|nr:hypothetical protein BC938DRAFT_478062 [Jimgerdemannia flammicorona]